MADGQKITLSEKTSLALKEILGKSSLKHNIEMSFMKRTACIPYDAFFRGQRGVHKPPHEIEVIDGQKAHHLLLVTNLQGRVI